MCVLCVIRTINKLKNMNEGNIIVIIVLTTIVNVKLIYRYTRKKDKIILAVARIRVLNFRSLY